jgi:hypothetical protein
VTDAVEQIGPCPKKVRGMAKASLDLIKVMREIAEATQPITGRGVGYKLFSRQLIPSMSRKDMKRVYRLLIIKEAREQGIIPWEWIVDETRELEISARGTIRITSCGVCSAIIAVSFGISSLSAASWRARRAPCAACSALRLSSMALDFCRCTGSAAQRPPRPGGK